MSQFLDRVNPNSRKARVTRDLEIDDDECAEFRANIMTASQRYADDQLINSDESSWPRVQVIDRTIPDYPTVNSDDDQKGATDRLTQPPSN
jgi:hypothetical protein